MLPQSTGRAPRPLTNLKRFMMTPGWSPSVLVNNSCPIRVYLQYATDCPVELGVHDDGMFAVLDGSENDVGCKFNGTCHLEDGIYALASHKILGSS